MVQKGIEMYDIIIIGGGPAGISAGIYAVSRGKKTLIIEKSQIGGIIGKVSTVTHYSAIVENESGATFAERLKRQALHAGVEIRYENVIKTELQGDIKTVMTEEGCYQAQMCIRDRFPRLSCNTPSSQDILWSGFLPLLLPTRPGFPLFSISSPPHAP